MKIILSIFVLLLLMSSAYAKKQDTRSLIGPTVHAPIKIGKNLFFLSTTGALYKSDSKLKTVKLLGKTKQVSVSPLSHDGNFLYFGDGLHEAQKSTLYKFDLKQNKIVKELPVKGHIQRKISISKESIFVGMGIGGLSAYDKDLKLKWNISKVHGKKLHIDSNPIIYKDLVCVASVYTYKAIICVDKSSGKLKKTYSFKESPKSELGISGKLLYGFTTEADMMKSKFDIKSNLYVINLEDNKLIKKVELRGYNFFTAPIVDKNRILVNLSTGDILVIDLMSGKIEFVGVFPEPFVSTPFVLNNHFCAIGIMGKLQCFEKGKNQYHITKDKRLFESPVGTIRVIDKKAFIPSRMGYFIVR